MRTKTLGTMITDTGMVDYSVLTRPEVPLGPHGPMRRQENFRTS